MSFKQITSFLLVFSLSACGWIRNDPKSMKNPAAVDLTCLNHMPTKLQFLFKGYYGEATGDQNEIKSIWACLDYSLNTFAKLTRGANPEYYTTEELQQFANRFLPANKPLTTPFVDSIFRLKAAEVGGYKDRLTRQEIEGIRRKLNRFGEIILPLSPYIGFLLDIKAADASTKKISSLKLRQFVSDLSSVLADSAAPLAWDDVLSFLLELDQYTSNGTTNAVTIVKEQIPIYKYFKLLLVGGDVEHIEREKWRPIFDSISHFYNALFLSSNTSELLEQLDIRVESTEDDAARAVAELTGLFRVLKKDETLQSKKTIDLLSDRFAKALLINAVLFPRNTGSLSVKTVLKTDSIRKLAGYILDDALKLEPSRVDAETISKMSENVLLLIDQASVSNQISPNVLDHLDLSRVEEYLDQMAPLFQNGNQVELIRSGLKALYVVIPIFTGHGKDGLNPKDLRALIEKAVAIYLAWTTHEDTPAIDRAKTCLDLFLKGPSFSHLSIEQLRAAIDPIKDFIQRIKPEANMDWDTVALSLDVLDKLLPIAVGKNGENIGVKDLQSLGDKAFSAYAVWDKGKEGKTVDKIRSSVEILLKAPTFTAISTQQLRNAIEPIKAFANRIQAGSSFDWEILTPGLNTVDVAIPILIGGVSESIAPKDIRNLVDKGIALYSTWGEKNDLSIFDKIGTSVDTLLKAPSLSSVSSDQILLGLEHVRDLVLRVTPESTTNWSKINLYVKSGIKIKSYLLQSSERYLTHYELDHLSFLFSAFRGANSLGPQLVTLSGRLMDRPIMTAPLDPLLTEAEIFLPEGKKIEDYGFSRSLISDLKALLLGGSRESLANVELSLLSKISGEMVIHLLPKVEALPSSYSVGLNSLTLDMVASAVDILATASNHRMGLVEFKVALTHFIEKGGYHPREMAMDYLVTGLYQRVFNQLKTEKPKKPEGLTFTAQQLLPLSEAIRAIAMDLKEVEQVFDTYTSSDQRLLKRAFLMNILKSEDVKAVVHEIEPLLTGPNDTLHLPYKDEIPDSFSKFDITFKTLVYKFLNWIFPLYRVNGTPEDQKIIRLDYVSLMDLVEDINYLIYDLKLSFSDSPPEVSTKARMRSINLFTHTGDGDQYVSPIETTEFLTITVGGKNVLKDIEKLLLPKCFEGVTSYDDLNPRSIPVECLTKHFFDIEMLTAIYGNVTPQLIDQYRSWDEKKRDIFRRASLTSTQANWTENGSILLEFFEVFTSLPYYVEILFERLDLNRDDQLDFREAMGGFPIFCREINNQIINMGLVKRPKDACEKGQNDSNPRAAFGYIITKQKSVGSGGQANFLTRVGFKLWKMIWAVKEKHPGKKMKRLRIDRSALFNVMSSLASSPTTNESQTLDLDESESGDSSPSELQGDEQPESP